MRIRKSMDGWVLAQLLSLSILFPLQAQIDPEERQILHFGHSQTLKNHGPNATYAFYYWNNPGFPKTNQTLRLAIAPVYLDGELGFHQLLSERTDVGVGFSGGGFANSYDEVRRGDYLKSESFRGHGGGPNASIYHRFNPDGKIPLNGLVRGGLDYHLFDETSDTANAFDTPEDQAFFFLRTGLRFGGVEPTLFPALAFELSAWYELQYRTDSGDYGFADDRELETASHRLWARAQLNFTHPETRHYMQLRLMAGSVLDADRFSAFRIGGSLPFTSEFPLFLPGYFYNELSTEHFGLLSGLYGIPLGPQDRFYVAGMASTGLVDYIDGLNQPGTWHSGVGGLVAYNPPSRRWRVATAFMYGIDAIRDDGRGGYNVGLTFQWIFGNNQFASDRAMQELETRSKARSRFK